MTENQKEIDVVCGVITDAGGRYLVCRRPEGKHLGGLWEFPGGKVDAGELPEAALIRELEEELSIQVETVARLPDVRWNYEAVAIRLIPFLCKIVSGIPIPVEHSEICWEDFRVLESLEWAPADLPILEYLEGRNFLGIN